VKVATAYDGGPAVVRVEGRLDAEWSTHLADALDELLRSGARSAVVDLSCVTYISSAGTNVLTRYAHDFAALRGELFVGAPPPVVHEALVLAGLDDRVLRAAGDAAERRLRMTGFFEARRMHTQDWQAPATAVAHGRYEVSPHDQGVALRCRLYGAPDPLTGGGYAAERCRVVEFPESVFGLGVGAIGDVFDDCRLRLGELLAAAGVVAYLPTDGARIPDYLGTLRGHVPRALVGSAVTFEGGFSHLVRFSAAPDSPAVPLGELAAVCLDAVGAEQAGVVMVAESAGVVGAWLRRSPALGSPAESPDAASLRERLAFTAEPAYPGTTALVVGVVARAPRPPLAAHLRPMGRAVRAAGHLHAAVFPYQPVPQRTVGVQRAVGGLWQSAGPRAVLHLLADDRKSPTAGQSGFVRGLIWAAPIGSVEEVA
jgi:anti-anti-sigma factor